LLIGARAAGGALIGVSRLLFEPWPTEAPLRWSVFCAVPVPAPGRSSPSRCEPTPLGAEAAALSLWLSALGAGDCWREHAVTNARTVMSRTCRMFDLL
jgi:hypothetical protein